ncbi:MAG: hypothetical protein COB49_01975 [Alphaproteobacteria bacterium]|nr:MAG: hypothetical protein COB49_01975 [Alphaproteobacteria bacterium]
MAVFSLPSDPSAGRAAKFRWVTNRAIHRSPITGKVQTVDRNGGRWEVDVQLPPLTIAQIRAWFAALIRAQDDPVYFSPPYSSTMLSGGNPGSPLVNGAAQVGTSLITDAWAAFYSVSDGDFISFNNGSFDELHLIKSGTGLAADGLGNAILTIHPAIQISPPNNAVIRVANPRGQFKVIADTVDFDARLAGQHGFSFKLYGVGS